MIKKILILVALVSLVLFVWLDGNDSNNFRPGEGGIKGVVRLGPTCPRDQDQTTPECADKLYKTNLELVDFVTKEVVRSFSSKSDGTFSIKAPAGEYSIRSQTQRETGWTECGKNGVVPVEAGSYSEVIVFCDTGIR